MCRLEKKGGSSGTSIWPHAHVLIRITSQSPFCPISAFTLVPESLILWSPLHLFSSGILFQEASVIGPLCDFLEWQNHIDIGPYDSFGFEGAVREPLMCPSVEVFSKVIFTLKYLEATTEVLQCAGHGQQIMVVGRSHFWFVSCLANEITPSAKYSPRKIKRNQIMSPSRWTDKQNVVYVYNRISFGHKREWVLICTTTWMSLENITPSQRS